MQNLFIVGSPFCGSTIIGNTLNAHPHIFHAGEVDRLRLFSRYHGADACLSLDSCALCGLNEHAHCPVWDDLPAPPTTGGETVSVYRQLMARGGKPVVLDSSKNADWLAYLHDNGLRGASAILLSRNPLAFARSHQAATDAPIWAGVEAWRNIYNHALRVLIHRQIPFIALRHADLIEAPDDFYAKILRFAGLEGQVDRDNYFKFETHALGGNVGAFVRYRQFDGKRYEEREMRDNRTMVPHEIEYKRSRQKKSGPWRDSAWMSEIPDAEMAAAFSIPGVSEVMSLLGYSAHDMITAKQKWQLAHNPASALRSGLKWLRGNQAD
ncbi:sulfotransferase [Acidocella sp.]|uniref:sulfotransferase n=1 Tax=Acidocella sp. TaxID=50710 RepID=UPI003CFF0244